MDFFRLRASKVVPKPWALNPLPSPPSCNHHLQPLACSRTLSPSTATFKLWLLELRFYFPMKGREGGEEDKDKGSKGRELQPLFRLHLRTFPHPHHRTPTSSFLTSAPYTPKLQPRILHTKS